MVYGRRSDCETCDSHHVIVEWHNAHNSGGDANAVEGTGNDTGGTDEAEGE
jgi:hypothetical protein